MKKTSMIVVLGSALISAASIPWAYAAEMAKPPGVKPPVTHPRPPSAYDRCVQAEVDACLASVRLLPILEMRTNVFSVNYPDNTVWTHPLQHFCVPEPGITKDIRRLVTPKEPAPADVTYPGIRAGGVEVLHDLLWKLFTRESRCKALTSTR